MTACDLYSDYLGAIADGELGLVPLEARGHVASCDACKAEVRSHQAASARLKELLESSNRAPKRLAHQSPRRLGGAVAAVVAVLVASAGAVGWHLATTPDPVAAAVAVAASPLQLNSSNQREVGAWCRRTSGHEVPMTPLPGLTLLGARMDRAGSSAIVTVAYSAADGGRLNVSWLEGANISIGGVEERSVSGATALIVRHGSELAVIDGSASLGSMWAAAGAIESG